MNYKETLEYIYTALPMYQRIGSAAYKADLTNAVRLDDWFGKQHEKFKCIHIAGTNGKGSVSHMLASVLQSEGYRTGLYTSPHLLDFRERIRINGKPVPKEFVVQFIEAHKEKFETIQASFFEMTVFMAFSYFASEQVDFAVIETGLGGRLDTTNIIRPLLAIITNIGLDHTQFLGKSLEAIAAEKAGIIKPDIPVVISETQHEVKDIFIEKANSLNAPIIFADEVFRIDYGLKNTDNSVSWHLKGNPPNTSNPVIIDLEGQYQRMNLPPVLLAINLLREMGTGIKAGAITQGLSHTQVSTGLMGRWQTISSHPLTICDVAHNAEGFQYIIEQIASTPYRKLHMILGFVNDKDIQPILKKLPHEASYYICEPDIPRAMGIDILAEAFEKEKIAYKKFFKVDDAYTAAIQNAHGDDMVYIGGSAFIVADFLRWKKKNISF